MNTPQHVPMVRVVVRKPTFIYHCTVPGCRYAASGEHEAIALNALTAHLVAVHVRKWEQKES